MKCIMDKGYLCFDTLLTKHKAFELEAELHPINVRGFDVHFYVRSRGDHAGVHFSLDLWSLCRFSVTFYDCRHWNYKEGRWVRDDEGLPFEGNDHC